MFSRLTHRVRAQSPAHVAVVVLAIALALLSAHAAGLIHADSSASGGGYLNVVLELTSAANAVPVHQYASQSAPTLDRLYWGDRVLWTGVDSYAEGYRWLQVGIGDGRTGWMQDITGNTIEMNPVYTTPDMGRDALVRITDQGDMSHCRLAPSASADEVQLMRSGDLVTVTGGPYQAEYWMWWQYRLPGGELCWIVDVPGWISVVTPGVF